jgi:hypothetical protein
MENFNWNFRCEGTSVDIYATEAEAWDRFKELYPRYNHASFMREKIEGLALFDR